MNHGNHIRFGMASWIGTATLVGLPVDPFTLAAAVVGALLPDLDHPRSLLGQRAQWIGKSIRTFSQHRGITHSLFALVFFAGFLAGITYYIWGDALRPYFLPFWIGYASGILGDVITAGGVQFWWPSKRWVRVPKSMRFSSGSPVEIAIAYSALILSVWYWIARGDPRGDLLTWVQVVDYLVRHATQASYAWASSRPI